MKNEYTICISGTGHYADEDISLEYNKVNTDYGVLSVYSADEVNVFPPGYWSGARMVNGVGLGGAE